MEVKLLATPAEQIAEDIMSGKSPPETYDLEVIQVLYGRDPTLTCYRIDDKYGTVRRVEYDNEDVGIALGQRIEMRGYENFDDSDIGKKTGNTKYL